MHKWAVMFILLMILFVPLTAGAQSQITIDSLEVQLWPEYDRPGMLVIYYLEISADTSLPAEVNIRIPKEAGKPHVIAVGPSFSTASDQNVDYFQEPKGDWLYITVTATGPAIVFEYYLPLDKQLKTRHFEFDWQSEYDVNNLLLMYKMPSGSGPKHLSTIKFDFTT